MNKNHTIYKKLCLIVVLFIPMGAHASLVNDVTSGFDGAFDIKKDWSDLETNG